VTLLPWRVASRDCAYCLELELDWLANDAADAAVVADVDEDDDDDGTMAALHCVLAAFACAAS
jgi:hypothetical protein